MNDAATNLGKDSNLQLPKEVIKTVEKIISSGNDVRISTGKHGLVVYEEKIKKKYSQS